MPTEYIFRITKEELTRQLQPNGDKKEQQKKGKVWIILKIHIRVCATACVSERVLLFICAAIGS